MSTRKFRVTNRKTAIKSIQPFAHRIAGEDQAVLGASEPCGTTSSASSQTSPEHLF